MTRQAASKKVPKAKEPELVALPLFDFEAQLQSTSSILQKWLKDCEKAEFDSPQNKYLSITRLVKGIHEYLKLVLDTLLVVHELHDVRTFNRVVLETLRECAPEIRVQVLTKLREARALVKALPGVELKPEDLK